MITIQMNTYKDALNTLCTEHKITPDTASKYLSCMSQINRELEGLMDTDLIDKYLRKNVQDDRIFNQYMAAIRKYEILVLKQPKYIIYGQKYADLVNHFKVISHPNKRARSGLSADTVSRKINAMRNEKLRLAFRFEQKSGLESVN